MAQRIFIFSIVLGTEYLSDVKSLETHARTFLTLDILYIGTVVRIGFLSVSQVPTILLELLYSYVIIAPLSGSYHMRLKALYPRLP